MLKAWLRHPDMLPLRGEQQATRVPSRLKHVFVNSLFRSVYKELHADHETGAADNKTG